MHVRRPRPAPTTEVAGAQLATAPGPADSYEGGTDVKKATDDGGAPEVVEAPGFTVTDPQGRTRLFLGDLSGLNEPWRPGFALYDEHGTERVSLLLGDAGPILSYTADDGDTRLEIGVVDRRTEGTDPGPFLVVVGPHGETAWSVRVNDEGLVPGD
jgi:hypothetical protein